MKKLKNSMCCVTIGYTWRDITKKSKSGKQYLFASEYNIYKYKIYSSEYKI